MSSTGRICSGDRTLENSDCLEFGTFDVSREILEAIIAGEVSFGIDQQEYLQGYLAIAFLAIRSTFQGTPGAGDVVLSGGLIARPNIAIMDKRGPLKLMVPFK